MYNLLKEKWERINIGLLLVISMFPIMPNAVQSLSFMLFVVSLVFCNFSILRNRIRVKKLWLIYFIITGYLWYSALTIFWSFNINESVKELGRQSLLFIFPFITIFLFKPLDKKTLRSVSYSYLIGLVIYIAIWFFFHVEGVSVYQEIITKEVPLRDKSFLNQLYYFFNTSYTGYISGASDEGHKIIDGYSIFRHRIYISSYCVFGFFISNWLAFKERRMIGKIVFFAVSLLLFFFILYLSSIQSLLLLIIALIFSLNFIKSKKAILFIALGGIVFFYKPFSNKFSKIENIELVQKVDIDDDQNVIIDYKRYIIYECVSKKLNINNFFGLGIGDVQDYLDKCIYNKNPTISYAQKEYNSHSQFLHYFMVGGIINFLLFLFSFYYLFKTAYKEKNIMHIYFLLIVFILCMFENYLSRVYGILFYSLFFMLSPRRELS